MSANPNLKENLHLIAQLLSVPQKLSDLERVLSDLLTPAEINDLAERWVIVCELLEGKVQRDINRDTGVSISKITRASLLLNSGGEGFRLLWAQKAPKRRKK